MTKVELAKRLRQIILEYSSSLTDEEALEEPIELFNKWHPGVLYSTGTRVRYENELYKVLQDHTSQENWLPTEAVSLYSKVLPGQDGDIGEWVQPDSTNPYMKDDKVTHNGKTWISIIDYNVWEPGVYGWNEI